MPALITSFLDDPKFSGRIIVAGIPRSGSTWQFNAVREILSSHDIKSVGAWVDDCCDLSSRGVLVVKVHNPETIEILPGDVILTTRRSIISCLRSMHQMGWLGDSYAAIRARALQHCHLYCYWRCISFHESDFELISCDQATALRDLSSALGLSLSIDALRLVELKLNALVSPPGTPFDKMQYDKETLMHPWHRSSERPPRASIDESIWLRLREEISYLNRALFSDSAGKYFSMPI